MTKFRLLCALFVLAIGFASCSKDDEKGSIVGSWESVSHHLKEWKNGELKETSAVHSQDIDKHTYTFNEDGSASIWLYYEETKRWVRAHFDYQVTEDKLTLFFEDETDALEINYLYDLHQNELVLIENFEGDELRTTYRRK